MARANPLLSAFSAGEFSPKMVARTDFALYPKAAAIMENILVLPQGGWMRRPGTRFVEEIKDSSVKSRLKDFEFSTLQAYAIEMGEQYFRFYRNQGRIVVDGTAIVTNGDFVTDLSGWADISTGTGGISFNNNTMRLDATSVDANGLNPDALTTTPFPVIALGVSVLLVSMF